MKKTIVLWVSVFSLSFFLTEIGFAKSELNTPVLRILQTDSAVCIASNAGEKDVTIEMVIYAGTNGDFHATTGEQILQPHQIFTIGVSGEFYWQCKIIVVNGPVKSVRGVLYGVSGSPAIPATALEAR